jgi:CubicO group peptidase (beta-lactamase class C family)
MTEAQQRADHLATGHIMAFAIPFAAPELSGYLGGSSGVISTAKDMANYLILHTNQGQFENTKLLTPSSMTLLHSPPPHLKSSYAMGWFATTRNSSPYLNTMGFSRRFIPMLLCCRINNMALPCSITLVRCP